MCDDSFSRVFISKGEWRANVKNVPAGVSIAEALDSEWACDAANPPAASAHGWNHERAVSIDGAASWRRDVCEWDGYCIDICRA